MSASRPMTMSASRPSEHPLARGENVNSWDVSSNPGSWDFSSLKKKKKKKNAQQVEDDYHVVTPAFMVTKSCTKILILPKILPTRFCFTFCGNEILYKTFHFQDFPRLYMDG